MKKSPGTHYLDVFKREPLSLLAKETFWRARRRIMQKGLRARMQATARIEWRDVAYYKPDLGRVSSAQRDAILSFADGISEGRFSFLSYGDVNLGVPPKWNLDFLSGAEWTPSTYPGGAYVRHDGSDVKVPYELSRLQFLPVLGKAYRLTGNERYRDTAKQLLTHWIERNPPLAGVNWTIPMEASLRIMSICFLVGLLDPKRDDERGWRDRVLQSLGAHITYIEAQIEFSHLLTSNHYLSNITGLYCASLFLAGGGMERRRRKYRRALEREMQRQVYDDGGDYEASTGYQVLVAQLFTLALLANRAADSTSFSVHFVERLKAMFEWMNVLAGETGQLPIVGDCDDGRAELLSDDLAQMSDLPARERHPLRVSGFLGLGQALLGVGTGSPEDAAWYGLEDRGSQAGLTHTPMRSRIVLLDSGIAMARVHPVEVQFFAIPNGIGGRGSHTHNDKLSFILRLHGTEVLCDPGTGCYTRNASLRNRFRRTAAHNTLLVDGKEQNTIDFSPAGLFRSGDEAAVSAIEQFVTDKSVLMCASHEGYASMGVRHSRAIALSCNSCVVSISDHLEGCGIHDCELNLHVAAGFEAELNTECTVCRVLRNAEPWLEITVPDRWTATIEPDLVSHLYGQTLPSWTLRMTARLPFPTEVVTLISSSLLTSQSAAVERSDRLIPEDRSLSLRD